MTEQPPRSDHTTDHPHPQVPQVPTAELGDGRTIPQLGFGTYKIPPEETEKAVATALEIGYRHIDTAQMYRNEEGVGRALAASGLDREDVFVTTKLDNPNHRPADVDRSLDESLRLLGIDQVDLFLIHWPLTTVPELDLIETWRAVEAVANDGRARSIGVSNFQVHHLRDLALAGTRTPAVNQVEVHPWFANARVRAYGAENGILTQAWSPLGRGAVLEDPAIVGIAERLGVTPAQVVLAWHLSRGDVALPKSVHVERQRSNLAAADVRLEDRDVAVLDRLDKGEAGRQGSHPDTMDRM